MVMYVGIDLGTTNSAICSYNGTDIQVLKSPEQNDVTPSVIYYDRRGNRYTGKRAYDMEPQNPDSSAKLFKRFMGTSTPIKLPAVDKELTPEECSAEILRTLFGYLPEEMRQGQVEGTVITVPAAFNQMQRDATLEAAEKAGIGAVTLMQEPVAAVMSVMQSTVPDGMFLVYDLGGGTLDISIAESTSGRVSLLSHGGIAVCGGRDFDRLLLDNIVKPWLKENFALPDDLSVNPEYKQLLRLASWAAERAKIELSSNESAVISLTEAEIRANDEHGEEIYLEIEIGRAQLDELVAPKIDETLGAAREALEKAGLSGSDLERIVFVGGPTQYKPLRDKVSFELGVPASTDINPMTAVASGAAIFAESVDWASEKRGRKDVRQTLGSTEDTGVAFNYQSRTPAATAKIAVTMQNPIENAEFQIDSLDTGWSSGRMSLVNGAAADLTLQTRGNNTFKVFAFAADGTPISLAHDRIVITRTAASVDAIPASHSVGVEVLDQSGHATRLEYLLRAGDQLPKSGTITLKATESLKSGSTSTLNFKLWEGEISDPVTDNRFIGTFGIGGNDFDQGVIPNGADLNCEYEVSDSGHISLEVSVPIVSASFKSGQNFYSRQGSELNLNEAGQTLSDELDRMESRLDEIDSDVPADQLDPVRSKLDTAKRTDSNDPESVQEGLEAIQEAKRRLANVRRKNLPAMRKRELETLEKLFADGIQEMAKPSEANAIENLIRTARREIDSPTRKFEEAAQEIRYRFSDVLQRQDWFIVDRFKLAAESPHNFSDPERYNQLIAEGGNALRNDDIDTLRNVLFYLGQIRILGSSDADLIAGVNIMSA